MKLSTGRYKVKVNHISASASFSGLENFDTAYLGVSLNNPIFWHHSFADVAQWFIQNFSSPYLLLGDYLNRWNDMIFYSTSVEECIQKSMREANELRALFRSNENIPNVQELVWEDLIKTTLFNNASDSLKQLYRDNSIFHQRIQESAQDFVLRQIERGQQPITSRDTAIEYSVAYLLEELAVFQVLIEKRIPVQIYPGKQLPVLSNLHTNLDMNLPDSFRQGVFVELRVKKR